MGLPTYEVVRAVSTCLASQEYQPPSLPLFLDCDWKTIFRNDATPATATTPRTSKATKGKEILKFSLFLLLEDLSDDKPDDFTAVRSSLCRTCPGSDTQITPTQSSRARLLSPEILEKFMTKIDARLTEKAETVDSGGVSNGCWSRMGIVE